MFNCISVTMEWNLLLLLSYCCLAFNLLLLLAIKILSIFRWMLKWEIWVSKINIYSNVMKILLTLVSFRIIEWLLLWTKIYLPIAIFWLSVIILWVEFCEQLNVLLCNCRLYSCSCKVAVKYSNFLSNYSFTFQLV